MKKSIVKRAASLLMASAMAVSALSVFSASAHDITIMPSETTDVSDEAKADRYYAYQIFSGTVNGDAADDLTPERFEAVAKAIVKGETEGFSEKELKIVKAFLPASPVDADVIQALKDYQNQLKNIRWGADMSATEKVTLLLMKVAKGTFENTRIKDAFLEVYKDYYAVISKEAPTATEIETAKNMAAIRVAEVVAGTYKYTPAGASEAVVVGSWNTEDLQKFAAYVRNVVRTDEKSTGTPSVIKTDENNNKYWEINGLDSGYYLVVDMLTNVGEGDSTAPYFMEVVKDTTMKVKSTSPTVTKTITAVNGDDAPISDTNDNAYAAIGDVIDYKLVGKVPTDLGEFYSYYYYQFTDTMSKGLTLDADSVKVNIEVGGKVYYIYDESDMADDKGNLELNSNFWVSTSETVEEDTVLKVTFWDVLSYFKTQYSDPADFKAINWDDVKIVVTYSATLNSDAHVGKEGNPNDVYVTYTNNPGAHDSSKNPDPSDPFNPDDPTEPTNPDDPTQPTNPTDPDDPDNPWDPENPPTTDPTEPDNPDNPPSEEPPDNTGDTPKDEANVFTFEIDMNKVDANNDRLYLAGAGFTITNADGKTALFVEDGEGNAIFTGWANADELEALKAANFVVADIVVAEDDAEDDEAEEAEGTVDPIAAFKAKMTDVLAKTFGRADLTLSTEVFTVGTEGKLAITGLTAGSYNFSETTTPVGYGTVDDFTVTLAVALNEGTLEKSSDDDYYELTDDTKESYSISVPDNNAQVVSHTEGVANLLVMDPPATILPGTGGAGKYFYYISGTFLAFAGFVVLRRNKRKVNTIA